LSIFIEKNGKKILSPSFYIKILVFWGLISFTAIAMQPIQAALMSAIHQIRTDFIERLEEITGMEIRYSSIRPAFFGSFVIRNLSFNKDEDTFLNISRVQINFSIQDLIFNRKIIFNAVQIDRPIFQFDIEKNKNTLDFFSSLINNSDNELFLPRQANYQIRNGILQITGRETIYLMDGFNLNIREDNGEFKIDGKVSAEFIYSGLFDRSIFIRTDVSINGVYDNTFQNGNANFDFLHITYSEHDKGRRSATFFRPVVSTRGYQTLFTVIPFNINIFLADKNLMVRHDNYFFLYEQETGNILAEINLDDFRLSEIIDFSSQEPVLGNLFNIPITGSSSFGYIDGNMNYEIEFKNGTWSGDEQYLLNYVFNVNAFGNHEAIIVRELTLVSPLYGSLSFFGNIGFVPFIPEGTLFLDRFTLSGKDYLTSVFEVTSQEGEIKVSGRETTIAGAQINNLEIFLYPADNDITLTASFFSGQEGSVNIDAAFNRNPQELVTSLSVNSFSFFEITEIIRPFTDISNFPFFLNSYFQNTSVSANVFFSSDFNSFLYNAPNITFNTGNTNGRISISGTDRQIIFSDVMVFFDEQTLTASANMNYENPMNLVFSVDAVYQELSWNIRGNVLDRTTLIVNDPAGLNIYGNISNSGALSGFIEGNNYPIMLNSETLFLNFYSALRYNSSDFWNLDINRFSVRNPDVPAGQQNVFSFSGIADQNGASFRDLFYSDPFGILIGSVNFSWDNDFSYIEFLANLTDGQQAGENYFAEGVLRNEQINITASVFDMNVNRLINGSNPIRLNADISATWNTIESFNTQINMTSFKAIIQNDIVNASANIYFSNDELIMHNLRFNISEISGLMPELHLSRTEGNAKASIDFEGYNKNKRVEAKIGFDANFSHLDSWLDIRQVFNEFAGLFVVENIQYGDLNHKDVVFVFSRNEGALSFSGGIRNMLRFEMDKEGNFVAGLSAPFPIRGVISGTYNKGMIDAYSNNFFIDLATLYSVASSDVTFNVVGGYITGEMNFLGPFWNPEFHGLGRATSMRFQVPDYISEDIRLVPFDVIAEGQYMTFGPLVATVGSGSASSSGWFQFENWIPVIIGLDINIPRGTPIPYGFNMSGFTATGETSGHLIISVDSINNLLELKGDLFTNETELGLNMQDFSGNFEIEDNNRMPSIVDLRITVGTMVEFVWPAINPIIRANPELGTVINIYSDTQNGQFSLNSDARIRMGELNYFDRSFFIREGIIVFREDQNQFNPLITARAEIRDRSDTGPVTIIMIIDSQPLLSFEPRFESRPGLTQLEIYSILGQNFNNFQGNDSWDMAQRIFLTSSADILTQLVANSGTLTQFMFFRQVERQIRDMLRLDMFSVRTRLLHNMVIFGATGFGNDPVDRNYGVGNYFDNTTVSMGRYIGRDIFIHGTLRLRNDESRSSFGGLLFEPDIGIEFNTPYVNIRWDFFPSHFQNFWVNDHSITLSWSMSF